MSDNLQFSDAVRYVFKSLISEIHTALPGKFEKYEHAKKKAEVKPLIKKVFVNDEVLELPVITNVPVIFPGTSDALITYPIAKGDGCLIIFSERSLERYLSSAMVDTEPQDPRKFSLSDGIAIPGLFTFKQPGKTSKRSGADLEIIYKDTYITIDSTGVLTLRTGDAAIWQPNVLVNDPFTGIPHGGVTGGISKLKGANS
ncbi:MAG: Gp138 family membrane-puncturing spike protein [Candidatus Hodarchaeota archaeon]